MSVLNFLNLSTGHLTDETVNTWAVSKPYPVIADYNCGLFVVVPPFTDIDDEGLPADLRNCIEYAREKGCAIIRFDTDADYVDRLTTYDW